MLALVCPLPHTNTVFLIHISRNELLQLFRVSVKIIKEKEASRRQREDKREEKEGRKTRRDRSTMGKS